MHIVFYQAIEDNLRLVYDQILTLLSEINLRDSDALHFIKERDFKIIEKSFTKLCKGCFVGLFMHKKYGNQIFKRYKTYSRAYYQEIIVRNEVEARTQHLFKKKFMKTNEDIDSVLDMYC